MPTWLACPCAPLRDAFGGCARLLTHHAGITQHERSGRESDDPLSLDRLSQRTPCLKTTVSPRLAGPDQRSLHDAH